MVPFMFSMVVVVGLPSGSVTAARNLTAILATDVPEIAIAAVLMAFAVVIAFWAFIGFENLTFLARELPHPRRDFAPVAIISPMLLLVLVLTLTVAVQAQSRQVDPVTGTVDALRSTPWGGVAASVLAAMGILAITPNAVAWTRGVATIVAVAATERIPPRSLGVESCATPRRAILVLSVGFTGSLVILLVRPELVVDMIGAASGVFVITYIMCILVYVRTAGLRVWSAANLALIPLMAWSLIASMPLAIFPVTVVLVAGAVTLARARSRA